MRQIVNYNVSYALLDSQSKYLDVSSYYPKTNKDANENCPEIRTSSFDSIGDINLQSYFRVAHYPNSDKISFRTRQRYYNKDFKKEMYKFLGYKDEKLSFVDETYLFDIVRIHEQGDLLTNQSFLIKIPDASLYLQSIPCDQPESQKLLITEFQEEADQSFYFSLLQIQHPHLTEDMVRKIEKKI